MATESDFTAANLDRRVHRLQEEVRAAKVERDEWHSRCAKARRRAERAETALRNMLDLLILVDESEDPPENWVPAMEVAYVNGRKVLENSG